MTDIKSWLAEHGFERFTDVFVENEIDLEALSELTDERAKTLARALNVHPAVLLFPGWRTEDESAA